MKTLIKNHKKLFIILIVIFLLLFSVYFLIKQPLFFNYELSEFSIFSKLSLANESTLKGHVKFLAENNRTSKEGQEKIVNYILNELKKNKINEDAIQIQKYTIDNREYKNIIVNFSYDFIPKELPRNKKYIIGAHYDSYGELPWADDNASAIAGLLEIARILSEIKSYNGRDIDLVFYSTEEPPFFRTENMGSFHHANSIKDKVDLVIILEMIGYFSEEENSQNFPISFLDKIYPTKGNFIAIVSNFSNIIETRKVKGRFSTFLQKNELISVESINAPEIIPGIDFSDHQNYWKFDIPAVMITDTSFYRNKNYHTKLDTYEKLDYKKMKEVIDATISTVLSI